MYLTQDSETIKSLGLKPIQARMLALLCDGMGMKQIATTISRSMPTTYRHMDQIRAKLSAKSCLEVAVKVWMLECVRLSAQEAPESHG